MLWRVCPGGIFSCGPHGLIRYGQRMRTCLSCFVSICLLTIGVLLDFSAVHGQNTVDYGCLEFEDLWINHSLIDLSSGTYVTDATNEQVVNQIGSVSPDEQYIAYIPISNS